MSIRLSKACKDLNVGMSTAVEFLAKKGHKIVVDPNLKLSDDLHLLLAKEFNKDMALKIESERLSQERHLKDKAETVALEGYNQPKAVEKTEETIHVKISEDQLPHFKSVGHIDLEAKDKHIETKPEEKKKEPVVEKPIVIEKPIEPEIIHKVVEKVVEEPKKIQPEQAQKPAESPKPVETPKPEQEKEVEIIPVKQTIPAQKKSEEPKVIVTTKEIEAKPKEEKVIQEEPKSKEVSKTETLNHTPKKIVKL
ncbi:MAG: translation initiation factor IF-2, partial [Paludibacter sp.]